MTSDEIEKAKKLEEEIKKLFGEKFIEDSVAKLGLPTEEYKIEEPKMKVTLAEISTEAAYIASQTSSLPKESEIAKMKVSLGEISSITKRLRKL